MIRSLRDRCPPSVLSSRMCRSSSSVWVSSSALARPRPRTRRVRLLAVLSSQITGQNTRAISTSGGAVTSARIRGARIASVLGACSPSAMCRKVTRHKAATGTIPTENPGISRSKSRPTSRNTLARSGCQPCPGMADHRQLAQPQKKTGYQAAQPNPGSRGPAPGSRRDSNLRSREVDIKLVQRLAGHPGRPASLLHQLVDLARADLDKRKLGGDEIGVDQNQSGDDQEV